MDTRFYNSDKIDIERLGNDLVNAYIAQGYQAQLLHQAGGNQVVVQLKKGGDFEAIIGMQAALTLTLQRQTGGIIAMIGQQRWVDKAAVGVASVVIPFLWPLALTAGAGAIRQASLGNQVLNMVDGLVRQQYPEVQVGPVPSYLMPEMQNQWAPPSQPNPYYNPPQQRPEPSYYPPTQRPPQDPHQFAPFGAPPQPQTPIYQPPVQHGLRCTNCNTPYEAGDTFCTGCGRSLAPAKLYCSRCHYELKPGASFCPKCGESTFTTLSGAQQASQPKPAPVQPTPNITYQPKPPTPTYTPPAKPEAPYYTPPVQPVQPVEETKPATPYYTPSQPAKVTEPPVPTYTPPTPGQQPPVVPKLQISVSQPAKPATPPPPKAPKPPKVYYVPSNQAQPAEQATQAAEQVWGTLTLKNGRSFTFSNEHIVVGRGDHDSPGLAPDVDLSTHENSDTVSRVHATIEFRNGLVTVTDLNSTNKTRINGNRLEPDTPTSIKSGDELQFGKIIGTLTLA